MPRSLAADFLARISCRGRGRGRQPVSDRDVTAALATCAGCGAVGAVGTLLAYGHAMGTVLRCPGCDAVLLRVVRAPGRVSVSASGIARLVIPDDVAPS
jgi:hypothetical protein